MSNLTIGGETFRVEVEGPATRPVVMLSHSLGTDLDMWAGQMPALTRHFRVVRYDTRGHGGSTVCEAPASVARLGADALAILDALKIERVHWIGLSMGGAIGLWLLANAPERIDRAVLANTAPKLGSPDSWNTRITSILAGGMDDNATATLERWFSSAFTEREAGRVAAIRTMLRSTSPQGYAACCAALRDMDLRGALDTIAHQVLIVTGRDDPVVPRDDAAAFVARLANAEQIALDAMHMSNIEAESVFNSAVVDFLTAKAPSRAKAAPAKRVSTKPVTAKRGGVSRRASAARAPLKRATTKKSAAKKRASPAPTRTAAPSGRRTPAKTSATRRGAAPNLPKKATKKAAAKVVTKPASRRPTPTAAARGVVKKAKAKKPTTKVPAKKAAPKRVAKKAPGARRRPAKKPGRPTGRRKT